MQMSILRRFFFLLSYFSLSLFFFVLLDSFFCCFFDLNCKFSKMVVARIKEIDDPELENRFEIASNTVRSFSSLFLSFLSLLFSL